VNGSSASRRRGVKRRPTASVARFVSGAHFHGMGTDAQVQLELATRWQRFLGQMIDSVFAGLPMAMTPAIMNYSPLLAGVWTKLAVSWMVLYLAFSDGFHGGQSFAKQWLGMRVVDANTGAPCTWGDSFIRNVFSILGPLDALFIFGEDHQRLGDKAAGTVVIVAD
jgi:uncharacterized RDD family membrane protein YckC